MVEFFGKIFGGNKNEENEYNRDNYEKAEESVEVADKMLKEGTRINNDMVHNLTPKSKYITTKGSPSKFLYNKEVEKTVDVLDEAYKNMVDVMEKRLEEVKKDFEKLKEKGEKEAYALNKEYDALLSKFSAKMVNEFKKNTFFGINNNFEEKMKKGIEFEKNAVEKFEQEKLGMKEKKEE